MILFLGEIEASFYLLQLLGVGVLWYLSAVQGCVLGLDALCFGGQAEDHLGLQAERQVLVVLLLCTVAGRLAVLVLRKQVRVSLHQELQSIGNVT